jgi:RNA polymerase sigma-70 factor (ECF subfamily)
MVTRMGPPARDPQFVLEHSGFVRALAQRLVYDPELAREVEQETWLAALRHAPPERASPRAWLTTLARNFAIKAWRGRARREAREHDRPPPPSTPTPSEILEREALRREIVEALLALDEPWRETLVLHFMEELPVREVSARMGVPLETVRTRVKRGLELLRARLERRTNLRGAALPLALIEAWRLDPPPLVSTAVSAAAPSLASGVLLVNTLTKSLLAAAAALVVLVAVRFAFDGAPGEPEVAESAAPFASLEFPAENALDPAAASEVLSRAELPIPTSALTSSAAQAPTTGSLVVRARWTDDGSPAAGIGFDVHQSGAEDFYFDVLPARTAADGSARLENVAPGNVSLYCDRGVHAGGTVRAGETTEIEFALPVGFRVAGRVLDALGRPVAAADVFLWTGMNDPDQGWVVGRSNERGEYELRGLRASGPPNYLSARAPFRAPTPQRLVMGGDGATLAIDIVFGAEGGALTGRVTGADGVPIAGASVVVGLEYEHVRARMPDGAEGFVPAGQRALSAEDGSFTFDGLPAGEVVVRARARGRAPWRETVESAPNRSRSLAIVLLDGARVEGVVRDAAGKPVRGAEVMLDEGWSLEGAFRTTREDGTFEIAGAPVGEFKLVAASDEFGSAEARLFGVAGETLRWAATLSRGLVLRVRVEAPGADLSGWSVQAEGLRESGDRFVESGRANAEGRAEIVDCPGTPLRVELRGPEGSIWPRAVLEGVRADAGEIVLRPDPDSEPSVRLRGRVVDEQGEPVGAAKVSPMLRGHPVSPIDGCDGTTGRFELGPFRPGEWTLLVRAEGFADLRTDSRRVGMGETWDLGDLALGRGGFVVVRFRGDLDGAWAYLKAADERSHQLRGAEGVVHSTALAPGEYLLVTGGREAAIEARDVEVRAGATLDFEIELRRGSAVRLAAPADRIASLEAPRLEVFDERGRSLADVALGAPTAPDSVLLRLAGGRYRASVRDARGRVWSQSFEVPAEVVEGVLEVAVRLD